MPINISNKIKNEIVDTDTRNNIEDILWTKAAGKCFLCSQTLDTNSDNIVADHDVPSSLGGVSDPNNLNLVHSECNSFKQANSSLRVQKFLPLRQYMIRNPDSNFGEISRKLFDIRSEQVIINWDTNSIANIIHGSNNYGPFRVHEEKIGNEYQYFYIFGKLPLKIIFNDNVQPRSIKSNHVFNLFQDLHLNPLHEPVGLRLESTMMGPGRDNNKLLMFDGQHKAVAMALLNAVNGDYSAVEIDVKIYLNFKRDDAVKLVNSIQSKIIKLGLTKSEFANKMSEELKDAFDKYSQECLAGGKDITEIGFVNEKAGLERKRRKEALINARYSEIVFNGNSSDFIPIFQLTKNKKSDLQIKENTFYKKILDALVETKPTSDPFIDGDSKNRSNEKKNIREILNVFNTTLFTVPIGQNVKDFNSFTSQSSLNLLLILTVKFCNYKYGMPSTNFIFNEDFDTVVLPELKSFVERFKEHPIWSFYNCQHLATARLAEVSEFYNLLQKNQSLIDVADRLGLNNAYCMGVTEAPILARP